MTHECGVPVTCVRGRGSGGSILRQRTTAARLCMRLAGCKGTPRPLTSALRNLSLPSEQQALAESLWRRAHKTVARLAAFLRWRKRGPEGHRYRERGGDDAPGRPAAGRKGRRPGKGGVGVGVTGDASRLRKGTVVWLVVKKVRNYHGDDGDYDYYCTK